MGRDRNAEQEFPPQMSGALPQVTLVRHGETAWTLSGQATERTDLPLTEQGEREARKADDVVQERCYVQA